MNRCHPSGVSEAPMITQLSLTAALPVRKLGPQTTTSGAAKRSGASPTLRSEWPRQRNRICGISTRTRPPAASGMSIR